MLLNLISLAVLILYAVMKANRLLKENIAGLLRARHSSQKDLAQWCHRSEGWLSAILTQDKRRLPTTYYDRIADFFGLATYQLFQPGIAGSGERRRLARRLQPDRRISRRQEQAPELQAQPARADSLHSSRAQAQLDTLRAELSLALQHLAALAAGHRSEDAPLSRPIPSARARKPTSG